MLVLAVAAVCAMAVTRGLGNLSQAQEELQQVRLANQRLERENRGMYRLALRLRSDPQAQERAVRGDMGYVRADEVVYQSTSPSTPAPAVKEQQP